MIDITNLDYIIENYIVPMQNNQQIFLGGSISLMLQDHIPYRNSKDIDLISTFPIKDIKLLFKFSRNTHKSIFVLKDKIHFDLFYNPNAGYVEYNYKNKFNIKLSPIEEIIYAKEHKIWNTIKKDYKN